MPVHPITGEILHADQCVSRSDIRKYPGARLTGLAPIGIKWGGYVSRNGKIRADKGCPHGEFVPVWLHIPNGPTLLVID